MKQWIVLSSTKKFVRPTGQMMAVSSVMPEQPDLQMASVSGMKAMRMIQRVLTFGQQRLMTTVE